MCVSHSVVSNSGTPWTVALQAPLSMEFSREEDWSGLPCPTPGDLPDSGIEPRSPALQRSVSLELNPVYRIQVHHVLYICMHVCISQPLKHKG